MRETCRSDDLCKTHLCTQPPPLPWANQSLPAGEVLLVLGQGLLLDAAERSCAWGRMQKPDSLAGIYLVEARVHVGGRDEEVLQAPSVRAGWKNFPSKLLGKVPAHVFTTEVKPVVAFLKQALACPLAIGQKVLAVFPAPGGLTWEVENCRSQECLRIQQELFAWKESSLCVVPGSFQLWVGIVRMSPWGERNLTWGWLKVPDLWDFLCILGSDPVESEPIMHLYWEMHL